MSTVSLLRGLEDKCREHKSSTCCCFRLTRDCTARRIGYYCSRVPESPGRACTGPMCLPVSSLVSLRTARVFSPVPVSPSHSQHSLRTGFFTGWLSRLSPGAGQSRTLKREDRRALIRLLTDTLLPSTDNALMYSHPANGFRQGAKKTKLNLRKLNDIFKHKTSLKFVISWVLVKNTRTYKARITDK